MGRECHFSGRSDLELNQIPSSLLHGRLPVGFDSSWSMGSHVQKIRTIWGTAGNRGSCSPGLDQRRKYFQRSIYHATNPDRNRDDFLNRYGTGLVDPYRAAPEFTLFG